MLKNINYKDKSCSLLTLAMPTMSSMSTPLATSTTTTRAIRFAFPRLDLVSDNKQKTSGSICVLNTVIQGAFILLSNNQEKENNSVLDSDECSKNIAEDNKEQLFNDMFDSMLKRKSGVMWKPSVKAFVINGTKNIYRLTKEIIDNEFESGETKSLMLSYPKIREVRAIVFKDRIYQGFLNDRYLYKKLTNSFVYMNMACQLEKGADRARELLKKYLWRYFLKKGNKGYVLQMDIHKYFQTISRDKALNLFRERLPDNLFKRVEEVINKQYPDEFYPGSQMIQLLGITFLDKLDHVIKEKCKAKYYIRYQDDLLLISDSPEYLYNCLEVIREELKKLGLEENQKKTLIRQLNKDGIKFLGFIFKLKKNGKIYMEANPKRLKEIKRRLRKYNKNLESYIAYYKKGNCEKVIDNLIKEFGNDESKDNQKRAV